jgi:hypothetical protein
MASKENEIAAGSSRSQRPRIIVLVLVLVLLLVSAAGVAYVGIQYRSATSSEMTPLANESGPVVRIEMPHVEIAVPDGPHREKFQTDCTICHSLRLPFTQPRLAKTKWQEVVHKMVAVYGAPLGPDDEREIVEYLSAVHSRETK